MFLRYHNTDFPEGRCLSIFSMPPQKRAIFSRCVTNLNGVMPNLWFLDTHFVFQYVRVPGGFFYPGVHGYRLAKSLMPIDQCVGSGLHVFFTKSPLESFDDQLYCCPTEHHWHGMSCTDHTYDAKVFNTPLLLFGTILNSWFSTTHLISEVGTVTLQRWKKMSLPNMLNHNWKLFGPLSKFLPKTDCRRKLINEPIKLKRQSNVSSKNT